MGRTWDIKVNKRKLEHLSTEHMVKELYMRGATIEDIFGMYYALGEQVNHRMDEIFGNSEEGLHGRQLTVGDAIDYGTRTPAIAGKETI